MRAFARKRAEVAALGLSIETRRTGRFSSNFGAIRAARRTTRPVMLGNAAIHRSRSLRRNFSVAYSMSRWFSVNKKEEINKWHRYASGVIGIPASARRGKQASLILISVTKRRLTSAWNIFYRIIKRDRISRGYQSIFPHVVSRRLNIALAILVLGNLAGLSSRQPPRERSSAEIFRAV